MLPKKKLLKQLRRMQTYITVFLFLTVFFVCWKFTGFDIREIQLSNWGKSGNIAILWNSAICIFAISIFINSYLYLKNNLRIKYKKKFYFLYGFLSTCLLMVGIFNIEYMIIHNISAGIYFFLYPLTLFVFAYLNRKYISYSDWVQNIAISTSMALFPIILMTMFRGMAIAEIAHTILVIIYNIKIARHE